METIRERLRRIRVEQDADRRRAVEDESSRKHDERARQKQMVELRRRIKDEAANLCDYYDPMIKEILCALGTETWGSDKFTILPPSDFQDPVWSAVRMEGKLKGFSIRLLVTPMEKAVQSLRVGEKGCMRSEGFKLSGRITIASSDTSPMSFEEAAAAAFKSGPRNIVLSKAEAKEYARWPYKSGEFESDGQGLIIGSTAATVIVVLIGALSPQLINGVRIAIAAIGLPLIVGSIIVTGFGRRFRRLALLEKAVAVVAMGPGVLLIGCFILWCGAPDAIFDFIADNW